MGTVAILSGSNQGEREQVLCLALKSCMNLIGENTAMSSIYESKPWGFNAEQDFLNQVWLFETKLNPFQVLDALLKVEQSIGRVRKDGHGYQSRIIDLDILYFDEQVIETSELIVPHPRLHLRRFTLEPLVEVMPGFVHPTLKLTQQELLQICADDDCPKKWLR